MAGQKAKPTIHSISKSFTIIYLVWTEARVHVQSEDNMWSVLSFFMGSKAQTQVTEFYSKYLCLVSNLTGLKIIFIWQNYINVTFPLDIKSVWTVFS